MRTVRCTAGPIHEEGFVRREGFMVLQPADGIVGEVFAQVIVAMTAGGLGRVNYGGVPHQVRFILRSLAGEEAVEVFKAVAGRPIVEWPRSGSLFGGSVVPFAPSAGTVAVILQDLGHHGAGLGLGARVPVPVVSKFRYLAGANALVVAPGQKRGARRRTHRCCVKSVVGDALVRDATKGRRVDFTAVSIQLPWADVVDEHDDDVGSILREMALRRKRIVNRFLYSASGYAARWLGWKWQHFLRPRHAGKSA
jgi:hypothetical protein